MAVRGRKARKRAAAKTPARRARKAPASNKKAAASKRKAPAATAQSEIARLKRELRAASDRRAASAEILRAIAAAPGDAQRSLQQIAETTERLFAASAVTIRIAGDGDAWSYIVNVGAGARLISATVSVDQLRIGGHNMPSTVYLENRLIHLPDLAKVDPAIAAWPGLKPSRAAGTRTLVGIPLRREGKAIGAMIVHRKRVAAFSDDELALLQSFADQAVIAIENARSFNETQESLRQQTATAEILAAINASTDNLQPVFDAILSKAHALCGVEFGSLQLYDGENIRAVAVHNLPDAFAQILRKGFRAAESPWFQPALEGRRHLQVLGAQPDSALMRAAAEIAGMNTTLFVPMRKDNRLLGAIVAARRELRAFSDKEIALLESFAAQAALAVENARLFNETKEALERQTATADVLKVIASSPTDVKPVFDAIAQRSNQLIGGHSTAVFRFIDDIVDLVAFTPVSPEADAVLKASFPRPAASNPMFASTRGGEVVQTPDIEADSFTDDRVRELARARGFRSRLLVPLIGDKATIGVISVTRTEAGRFADQHVQLLKTFADQAVIAIQNAGLFEEVQARTRDLTEALQQQIATADVLKLISRSAFDLDSVLSALVESAAKLCEAEKGVIFRRDGDVYCMAYNYGFSAEFEAFARANPLPAAGGSTTARAAASGKPLQAVDIGIDDTWMNEVARGYRLLGGYRTNLGVPLSMKGEIIGVFTLTRAEPRAFTERQIDLVGTFADQAVIAIENTRLFNETREALERQTATAEILKVIAASPSDVQPVFEAIVERSTRLVAGFSAAVHLLIDGQQHLKAFTRISPEADAAIQAAFPRPLAVLSGAEQIRNGEIFEIADTELEFAEQPSLLEMGRQRGYRSLIIVPLLRDHEPIGLINVTRRETGRFAAHHVDLLRTFADQAVIAIENVRLFNETKEALERQTATADVLKVIASSPTDVQPVFDAIAARSNQLLGGYSTSVFQFTDDVVELVAFTPVSPEADAMLRSRFPGPVKDRPFFEIVRNGEIAHTPDAQVDELGDEESRATARARGFRGRLMVPLIGDKGTIGVIAVTRKEPGRFADQHVQLLQTFADQAVIAIQNVKLFDEVQARTRDLQESLQQQTATADVLKVINASPGDLTPVFEAMVEMAMRLCKADSGHLALPDGEDYRTAVVAAMSPEMESLIRSVSYAPGRGTAVGRALLERRAVQINDIGIDPEHAVPQAAARSLIRTILGVPLLREGEPIGAFGLSRSRVEPFTEREVELVRTFADQAVIAIENTRLLKELHARTDDLSESLQQQTATADVLKVISRSAFDLDAVMNTLTRSAAELCKAELSALYLREGDLLIARGMAGVDGTRLDFLRDTPLQIDNSAAGDTLQTGSILNVAEVEREGTETTRKFGQTLGFKSILFVPLMREGRGIGVFALGRKRTGKYSQREVELLQTFADQAVIAIENVRLFDEVQQRTRELTQSLDELRAAQDRLVQTEKLASLGQLTAGIAHEIKNPLNFVNNFAALSSELIDEMLGVLEPVELPGNARQEVDELTHMLKDNLDKVVQHGKRADSIVKNMLMHSRAGAGERRAVEINGIVEESLNLAYHGARAEKTSFNITLKQDFDPDAGLVDVFPQEVTRVFLNLISNGFYAAAKRAAESGNGFEPVLSASTKNLGDRIEVRIRDNGTGIPPEVKDKMFNPFFTTKPAGEGTGLGLSISHDIIVKQHGGTIEVATEPGAFTEFTITLPRAQATNGGGRT